MPVRGVTAQENVVENTRKSALERGPIVHCVEWIDNRSHVFDLMIPPDAQFDIGHRFDMLDGVSIINGTVSRKDGRRANLVAIPYFAWVRCGTGEMAVW